MTQRRGRKGHRRKVADAGLDAEEGQEGASQVGGRHRARRFCDDRRPRRSLDTQHSNTVGGRKGHRWKEADAGLDAGEGHRRKEAGSGPDA